MDIGVASAADEKKMPEKDVHIAFMTEIQSKLVTIR